jgi:hypothetical protein
LELAIAKLPSKLLGPEHGDHQVHEAAEGDKSDEDIFHGWMGDDPR